MHLTRPPCNVLLIQLGDIGDVVLTSPSLKAVKENYPNAAVSILVSKPFGCLLSSDPNVHEVVEVSKSRGPFLSRLRQHLSLMRRIRRAHYDLVVDLRTGDRGAILTLLTGARVRIGRPGTKQQFWHGLAYTNTIKKLEAAPPPAHPGADQSLCILRQIGITANDTTPHLFISKQDRATAAALFNKSGLPAGAHWVTINPYSRWKYKEWDNIKWGQVIDRLWEAYRIPSVLVGSAEEAAGCEKITSGREGSTFNLAGKTTLGELAAVISMSSLHLGVDSAASHIAAALDVPTVTIHGPTDWRAWRIADERHRIVTPIMECVPCSRMGCDDTGKSECLEQLETATVLEVIESLLREFFPNRAAGRV